MSTQTAEKTAARDNTDWWQAGLATVQKLAKTGKPFDAYDVAQVIGEPYHPNHWGALFQAAKKHGLIEPHDFHQSTRPSRSGGVCRRWIGPRPAQTAEPVRLRAVRREGTPTPYELIRADQLQPGDVVARKASPNSRIDIVNASPSTTPGKTHIDYLIRGQGARSSEAYSGEKWILHERADA